MASSTEHKHHLDTALKSSKLRSDLHPDWCPGCGDFGITNALQASIADLKLKPWETYFFSGVGCSGKTSHYVNVYGAHTLHGRVLSFAAGAKISNPKMTVIAAGGDGDGYGIGAGHFLHAGRRNLDLTYVVFNNEVYGLTKGQASPTLPFNEQPKSLAKPNPVQGVNPLAVALTTGYTFIARSYSFDQKHLKETLKAAIEHKGMALVDVLQPCPTYNDLRTKDFFGEMVEVEPGKPVPRTFHLTEEGYDGKVTNPSVRAEVVAKQQQAFERCNRIEPRVPLGIFYQIELPTFMDNLDENIPLFKEYAPVEVPYTDKNGKPNVDLTSGMDQFII